MSADFYPPGYRDPDWDGTETGFRDVVLPARIAALEKGINDRYAGALPPGFRFGWVPGGGREHAPYAHAFMPDLGGREPPGLFVLRGREAP